MSLDAQCPGKGSRPIAEALKGHISTPSFLHHFPSFQRHQCPDEYCMGNFRGACHHIEQMVHAVAEVNIGSAPFLEHGFGARSPAIVPSMGGPVFGSPISFGFNDSASGNDTVMVGFQYLTQEGLCNGHHIFVQVKGFG